MVDKFEEIKNIIINYSQATADGYGLDYINVEEFITSEADLYLLTLLSKANKRGLDLNFIDKIKFNSASSDDVKPVILETGPWEGARFITISLDPLLHEGCRFEYHGHKEGFGSDFIMNTITLCNRIEENLNINNHANIFFRTPGDYIKHLNIADAGEEQIKIESKQRTWFQKLFN